MLGCLVPCGSGRRWLQWSGSLGRWMCRSCGEHISGCFDSCQPAPHAAAAGTGAWSSISSRYKHKCLNLCQNPGTCVNCMQVCVWVSYMAIIIKQVVGKFEAVEGDGLLHPLGSPCWRVRVKVDSSRGRYISTSSYHPGGAVKSVPWKYIRVI